MKVNSNNVPLGENGFALCQTSGCGKEVQEISREVSLEYAYCMAHQRAKPRGNDMTMKKKAKRESKGKHKIPAPIQFLKDMLSAEPMTREQLVKKMEKAEYAKGTINTQLFQLKHWKGAICGEDGFVKNPDFTEVIKEKKTPKPVRNFSNKKAVAGKRKTFHPVPKPSQKSVTA
jgi:hypothetical protein